MYRSDSNEHVAHREPAPIPARRNREGVPHAGHPGVETRLAPESSTRRPWAEVTVIVPTRNESDNIAPLTARLGKALAGHEAAVLFVDDSDDDTPDRVRDVGADSSIPVRLLHRQGAERTGGLGGAVLAGLRQVQSPWVVVMDGDLQHPPELVPALVEAGNRAGADVVVASRHVEGGSDDGLASGARVLVSSLSTWLSKAMFPSRLRGVSDPMSGFFAIRPGAIDLTVMKPPGFKVLLELLVRSPGLRKAEVPFVFGDRQFGESKASFREGMRFGFQLCMLSLSRVGRRLRPSPAGLRAAGFAGVGATGIVVNLGITWLLADPATLAFNYIVAAVLATQVSSSWNFLLTDGIVYRGARRYTKTIRWLGFMAMSNVVLVLRVPVLALLVTVLGMHYLVATAITLSLGFLLRFKSQERLTLTEEMA